MSASDEHIRAPAKHKVLKNSAEAQASYCIPQVTEIINAERRLSMSLGIGTAAPLRESDDEAAAEQDRATVADLDRRFQLAVKRNDAETMAQIMHPGMVLVLGDGRVLSRAEQLEEARRAEIAYERQDEDDGTQTVRVWKDTAVVTARLWIKGRGPSGSFQRRLWFSDTYVRTADGWKYLFGQASTPLAGE